MSMLPLLPIDVNAPSFAVTLLYRKSTSPYGCICSTVHNLKFLVTVLNVLATILGYLKFGLYD